MSTPKKRKSHGRSRARRSYFNIKPLQLGKCLNCKELKKPHFVCDKCGFYRGKKIV